MSVRDLPFPFASERSGQAFRLNESGIINPPEIDLIKQKLGEVAASKVYDVFCASENKDKFYVGLGTGTTAVCFIEALAKKCEEEDFNITAVASSNASYERAKNLGINVIKLRDLDRDSQLDVYVDGADEVDENLNMIKGKGGALHREKVLAARAKTVIIMIDRSKYVIKLGNVALPIEVTQFGAPLVGTVLKDWGYTDFEMRKDHKGFNYVTDNGNFILDLNLPQLLDDPKALHYKLKILTGVVETGIFPAHLVHELILGDEDKCQSIMNNK